METENKAPLKTPPLSELKKDNQNSEDKVCDESEATELVEVLDSLPEEKRKIIVTAIRQSSFRGPLPPPEILRGYESIVPHAAERILEMAEQQMHHRQKMEYMIVDRQTKQSRLGQILGFILVLLFGLIALFLGYTGHDTLAGFIGTTTILGLAVVFVLNKKPSDSEGETEDNEDHK